MSSLVAQASLWCGLTQKEIQEIAASAGRRYKVYQIPKKNGGMREIAQPAREVKLLQRFLIDQLWRTFPVHHAATAYNIGSSIVENASRHRHHRAILKLDFSNFFPSFRGQDVAVFLRENAPHLDQKDVNFAVNVSTRAGAHTPAPHLTIGSPSSPIITNVLMASFDADVEALLEGRATYSRYADDITISADDLTICAQIEREIGALVARRRSPPLTLKPEKRVLVAIGRRRVVTGIVLSDTGAMSLGRDKKRELSAAVHHFSQGRLDLEASAKLAGLIAFARQIDRDFVDRLRRKYGAETIGRLQAAPAAFVREGEAGTPAQSYDAPPVEDDGGSPF